MTACCTLVILPIKYIYELQQRNSLNKLRLPTDDDGKLFTDSSTYRTDVIENERDKLLIQPIVRCF